MNNDLIVAIRNSMDLDLPEDIPAKELHAALASYVNHLVRNDFQKLVSLLYRVDVDEAKLKNLLQENTDTDAASIIADLIIERQVQKLKSRQEYRRENNIDEEEKW